MISEKIFCILNAHCQDGIKLSENSYECKSKDKSYKLFSKNFSCFDNDLSQLFLFLNFHIMANIFADNRGNAIPTSNQG